MTIERGKVNSSVSLCLGYMCNMCEFKIKTKQKMDNEHCVVWSSSSPFNTITIETQWNHSENIMNVNISSARRKLWIRSVLVRINCLLWNNYGKWWKRNGIFVTRKKTSSDDIDDNGDDEDVQAKRNCLNTCNYHASTFELNQYWHFQFTFFSV